MTESPQKIVHEINNELAIIRASAELAGARIGAASEAQAHLDQIQSAAGALGRLVRELQGESPREADEPAPLPTRAVEQRGTILVVDDSETMRQLIAYALEAAGFEVVSVDGAEQALAHVQQGDEFDLLLADVHMPDTPGPALASQARRLRPELPVIFITGDGDAAVELDGVAATTIGKPFVASELVRAIDREIGR